MIDYCLIVKDMTTLPVRLETSTMEQYKVVAEDTDDVFKDNSIYPPTPNTISVAESPDLFPEDSQMSVEAQETIDLCTETDTLEGTSTQYVSVAAQQKIDLCFNCTAGFLSHKAIDCIVQSPEVTKTDPKEGESRKLLKLSSENVLKDSSICENGSATHTDEEDDDPTPDLDEELLMSKFKRDNSDTSKEQGAVAKSFVNLKKPVENAELENVGHCLPEIQDSDESDSSINSEISDVEGFKCNYDDCFLSHTTRYIREPATHTEHHETPNLDQFMERTVTMQGSEIIGLMSFYAHRLRECRRKLIEDYNIPPYIVQRWMDLL